MCEYKCGGSSPKPHTEKEAPPTDFLHGNKIKKLGIFLVHTIPPSFSQVPSDSAKLPSSLGRRAWLSPFYRRRKPRPQRELRTW